ncbi:MAG: hypothetical protein LIO77_00535 [Rikenellaceae bacterium]|nr:hypothetical protein [Rikenellaceae bacterium]
MRIPTCKYAMLALAAFFLAAGSLASQDVGSVLRRLAAADGPGGASITVTEKGEAASIVRMASSARRSGKVNGYRIRIFFDNKQTARASAYSAKARFENLFPGIPVDIKYDNPDWKVTAGYCLTNEEAIILLGRIKRQFPKAFPLQEEIPLEAFTRYAASPGEPEADGPEAENSGN